MCVDMNTNFAYLECIYQLKIVNRQINEYIYHFRRTYFCLFHQLHFPIEWECANELSLRVVQTHSLKKTWQLLSSNTADFIETVVTVLKSQLYESEMNWNVNRSKLMLNKMKWYVHSTINWIYIQLHSMDLLPINQYYESFSISSYWMKFGFSWNDGDCFSGFSHISIWKLSNFSYWVQNTCNKTVICYAKC